MLRVTHEGNAVGSLQPVSRDLEFRYAADWLSRKDAFALSPRMPLREDPWRVISDWIPSGVLHGCKICGATKPGRHVIYWHGSYHREKLQDSRLLLVSEQTRADQVVAGECIIF